MKPTTLGAILLKEVLALRRDPSSLALLFLMPAAFILVMSLALRDVFAVGEAKTPRIVVAQLDRGEAARALVAALPPSVEHADSRAAAEAALYARRALLAIIIPPGYREGLLATDHEAPLVEILAEPSVRPEIMRMVQARVDTAVLRQRIATRIAEVSGAGIPLTGSVAGVEARSAVSARHLLSPGGKILTATQQNVPAWLVFGMFFVVAPICNLLVAERTLGTLARLRTMLVPTSSLLVGKLIPFYLLNMLQVALMLLVGRYLVPLLGGVALDTDVHWGALAVITTATSVSALGSSILVASLARTTEQATTFGNLANVIFAAAGGVMVPKMVMPPFMQSLAQFSPMNWALEGFLEVFLRSGRLDVIAPYAALLLGMGIGCGAIAARVIARERR